MGIDRAFFTIIDLAFLSTVLEFISTQYQLWFVKTQVNHGDSRQQKSARSPNL